MQAAKSDPIVAIESAQNAQCIIDELSAFASPYGFGSLMLGHMTNPLSHPRANRFLLHTCRPEMMDRLQSSSAFFYDKVLHRMLRTPEPYSWSSVHPADPLPDKTMLAIVREFGFEDGYSFPIMGRNGTQGGVSLCGDARPRPPETIAEMHWVFTAAFHRLEFLEGPFVYERYPDLSPLEHAALQCAAGGKGVSETAIILGVAPISAKDALKRARRKLGARSTTQAVAAAVAARLIV